MPTDAPIRIASTVMLVRPAQELEVLMVKRNQQIDFFSGAMVFPGGKVEPDDLDGAWASHALGLDRVSEEERGPRIAALRETFEETGVLACVETNCPSTAAVEDARARMEAGELSFLNFVRGQGIVLDLARITLFARWLTPPVVPKRFDTFFYLIEMPAGQSARHDGREAVENEWVTAREALRRGEAGERTILFPTRQNLRLLSQTSSIAEAVRAAEGRAHRQVTPRIEVHDDGRRYLRLLPEDGYGEVFEPLAVGG